MVERQEEHQNDDGGGGDDEYNDDDENYGEYHKDEYCESKRVFGDDEGVIMWVG